MVKRLIPYTIAWEGKIYLAGSMVEVPESLSKALDAKPDDKKPWEDQGDRDPDENVIVTEVEARDPDENVIVTEVEAQKAAGKTRTASTAKKGTENQPLNSKDVEV